MWHSVSENVWRILHLRFTQGSTEDILKTDAMALSSEWVWSIISNNANYFYLLDSNCESLGKSCRPNYIHSMCFLFDNVCQSIIEILQSNCWQPHTKTCLSQFATCYTPPRMEHDWLAIKLSSVLQSERTFFYHG